MTRGDIVIRLVGYLREIEQKDRTAKALLRHVMGLYAGQPGARLWRRSLSEGAASGERPSDVMQRAHDNYTEMVRSMAA